MTDGWIGWGLYAPEGQTLTDLLVFQRGPDAHLFILEWSGSILQE